MRYQYASKETTERRPDRYDLPELATTAQHGGLFGCRVSVSESRQGDRVWFFYN